MSLTEELSRENPLLQDIAEQELGTGAASSLYLKVALEPHGKGPSQCCYIFLIDF